VNFTGIAAQVAIAAFAPTRVDIRFFLESVGNAPELDPAVNPALGTFFNTVAAQLNYPNISVVVPANALVQGTIYRVGATVRFGNLNSLNIYAGTGYIEGGLIQTADEITP
jgi:hypothetical protein